MYTKLSKLVGKISFDGRYVFQLGPRPTPYQKLRMKYWEDEHARNLEISRVLLANGGYKLLSEAVFQLQCTHLSKLANVSRESLNEETI